MALVPTRASTGPVKWPWFLLGPVLALLTGLVLLLGPV